MCDPAHLATVWAGAAAEGVPASCTRFPIHVACMYVGTVKHPGTVHVAVYGKFCADNHPKSTHPGRAFRAN